MTSKKIAFSGAAAGTPPGGSNRTLTVTIVGGGRVTGPGIDTAASDFVEVYPDGYVTTLQAIADPGFDISGWSGAATGTGSTKQITMNADKAVTVTFALEPASCYKGMQVGTPGVTNPDSAASIAARNAAVSLLVTANVGMVRILCGPARHHATNPALAHIPEQRFAQALLDNGIIPLPYWEYAGVGSPQNPIPDSKWEEYMTIWVAAMDMCSRFETGNEPDRPSSIGIGKSLAWTRLAAPIIRAATKKHVMVAAQSGTTQTMLDAANNATNDMFPVGDIFRWVDAVAIHCYPGRGSGVNVRNNVDTARANVTGGTRPRVPINIPLYITEAGIGTIPPFTGSLSDALIILDDAPPGTDTSLENQANWLDQMYNTIWSLRTSKNVHNIGWWIWKDNGPTDRAFSCFGLRFADNSPKPALTNYTNQSKSKPI